MSKFLFWKTDWFLGIAVAIAVILFNNFSDLVPSLERKAYDLGVIATSRTPSDKVAVIAIDEASIRSIGRWPWPRDVQARMTDLLAQSKVKVIGSTILLSEPQADPGYQYVVQLQGLAAKAAEPGGPAAEIIAPLAEKLKEAELALNTDRRLAESYAKAANVLVPLDFLIGRPLGKPDKPLPDYVQKYALPAADGERPLPAFEMRYPIEPIARAAAGLGSLTQLKDVDGAIRAEPLAIDYFGQLFPSLSMMIAAKYLNLGPADIKVAPGQGVTLQKLRIRTDSELRMYTYFYKDRDGKQAFPVDSFHDVLSGKIKSENYRGKIVLIGATAVGLGDNPATPIAPAMAPVLLLAHAVSSILQEHFFVVPGWMYGAELLAFVLVAAYLVAVLPRLKAGTALAVSGGMFAGLVALHFALMMSAGMWMQLMLPATLLLLGHGALVSKRFIVTERAKTKSDENSAESNRMLGLAYQGQGLLDQAWDKYRQVPLSEAVMDNLYNLALDFERKRQFNKAESVFRHMAEFNPGVPRPGQAAVARQAAVGDRDAGRRRERGTEQRLDSRHRRYGREADARPLSGGERAGQGRDGRGVPRQGSENRPRRGDQDHGAVAGVPSGGGGGRKGAFLPRGGDRGPPLAPEYRHHLRCRRRTRPVLHRHGTAQGRRPGPLLQGRPPAGDRQGGVRRRARRGSPRLRPHAGRGASRREAGEPHVRPRYRHPQGHRLRHRAPHGFLQDQDRHGARHAVVYVPGTAGRARKSRDAATCSRSRSVSISSCPGNCRSKASRWRS